MQVVENINIQIGENLRLIENILNHRDLSVEMQETLRKFNKSLHGRKNNTKLQYLTKLKKFGEYLIENGKEKYQNAIKEDFDDFLDRYNNADTLNLYIVVLKSFYSDFLGLPQVVEHLKMFDDDLPPISPSEVLTPEEIVKLAEESTKRRPLYKYLTLVAFESCARINEILNLKIGDVTFSSIRDKDGKRVLISTLHFSRLAKGGIRKEPVVLSMFATELKHWVENHPLKVNSPKTNLNPKAYLFPSPVNPNKHISECNFWEALWNAGQRLGLEKKCNPHWLRHSGLSYCSNDLNYNEQLLKWRAGWTNTTQAKRYIHSGAELENKAYLERQGYIVEEKEPEIIKSKTCPHCNQPNPYTGVNCDYCGMPLDLKEYKKEIEKKRVAEVYFDNLQKLKDGKLTEEQMVEINKHIEIVQQLPPEHAKTYLTMLLGEWTKIFLSNA